MSNFGENKNAFDGEILLKYVEENNIKMAQKYIETYFVKLAFSKQILMWIPYDESVERIAYDVFEKILNFHSSYINFHY